MQRVINRGVPSGGQSPLAGLQAVQDNVALLEDSIIAELAALASGQPTVSSLLTYVTEKQIFMDAIKTAKITSSSGNITLTNSVSVTNGSAIASSTDFRGEVIAGDTLTINSTAFTVSSVDSATQVTLSTTAGFSGSYTGCTANNAQLKAVDITFTDPRVSWASITGLIVTTGDNSQGYLNKVNGDVYWMGIYIDHTQSYSTSSGPAAGNCIAAISTQNTTMPQVTTYANYSQVDVTLRAVGTISPTSVSITEVIIAQNGSVELAYSSSTYVSNNNTSPTLVSVSNYIPPDAAFVTGTHRIYGYGITLTGDQYAVAYTYAKSRQVGALQIRSKPNDSGILQAEQRVSFPIINQNWESNYLVSTGTAMNLFYFSGYKR